jgi:hypothetical protein
MKLTADIKRPLTPVAIRKRAFAHHAKTGKTTIELTVMEMTLTNAEAVALERFWVAHTAEDQRRPASAVTVLSGFWPRGCGAGTVQDCGQNRPEGANTERNQCCLM